MQAIQIRLSDETGKVYRWMIRRVPRAITCNCGLGYNTRVVAGWEYTDHEGYTRFSEGNWLDLVAHFKATSANYGLSLMSELS